MKRVLIIDDDVDLLDLVCLMAKSSQMNPKCVTSGTLALEALATESFDLILMDIYLGDHDGRELARRLKTDDQFRHIPILLYSAGNVSLASVEESQADGFLQKPFEMKTLINRMRDLMVA